MGSFPSPGFPARRRFFLCPGGAPVSQIGDCAVVTPTPVFGQILGHVFTTFLTNFGFTTILVTFCVIFLPHLVMLSRIRKTISLRISIVPQREWSHAQAVSLYHPPRSCATTSLCFSTLFLPGFGS